MQRLQLNPEENITRKEYLKRKKKQSKKLQEKTKLPYVLLISALIIVGIYVFVQFYQYNKSQAFKYIEDENVNRQKVYNVYYVTEGYTYNPVYSLSNIYSNGFADKVVYQSSGLTYISMDDDTLYGVKDKAIYKIVKNTNEMELLIQDEVLKYAIYGDKIYYISGQNKTLKTIDINTKEVANLNIDNVNEILVDENYIFLAIYEKSKRIIVRYDKTGENKLILTPNENVSYIIASSSKVFFVNKKDENKIYSVNKDGSDLAKIGDFVTNSDNGDIKEIDGTKCMYSNDKYLYFIDINDNNSLCKVNLEDKTNQKIISSPVEILQVVGDTIFYKSKDEMGIYLYNVNTNFMSQVTKRKVKEFIVDKKEIKSFDTPSEKNKK